MHFDIRALAASLVMCAALSGHAWAQAPASPSPAASVVAETGTIKGKVVDAAGKPLDHARIAISGPTSIQMVTKADGTFQAAVSPGIYSVVISASGFQSKQIDSVVVFLGEGVDVATTLSNASLTTIASVSVNSATAVAASSAITTTLSNAVMSNQGQVQIVNVLDQVPGVEIDRVGGGSNEPGANTSISIRGAQPYESQVLVDGHPVDTIGNGPFGFNATFTNATLLSGIEVSKGAGNMPNTVVDAVGGTVNIQTPPITEKLTTNFMTQYDSFGGWTYGVRVSDTIGKIGFLAAVGRETTPGYMVPQDIFGFGRANFFSPYTSPTLPLTGNIVPNNPSLYQVYPPGTSYTGVLNYAYPATSDFQNDGQLFKLAYNFSPVTSLQVSSYSTQTWLDETGNNVGNIYVKVVPCITNNLGPGSAPGPTASCAPGTSPFDENYTATPYLGYVGKTVPLNLYAGYPNTYETDNEPIFTGDLRTVIGSGTFLARVYAGSITRDVIQNTALGAVGPCYSASCPWVGSNTALSTAAGENYGDDNGYAGEPYYELTTDILHGFDAQFRLPLGDNGDVTLGFDTHSDSFNYTEAYSGGWFWQGDGTVANPYSGCGYPGQTAAQIFTCAYQIAYHPQPHITIRSTTENVRGNYMIAKKLQLEFGGYFSDTTYVGSRLDPRGGLTWRPNAKVSVHVAAGSAYVTPYQGIISTAPSYDASHGGTLTPATTQFQAETSMGYDVGADYAYSANSIVSADLYSTTIFNRYAQYTCQTAACAGLYQGNPATPYTSEVLSNSQGQTATRGLELALLHQPKFGFGYHAAVDLLRDYSYDQIPIVTGGGLFLGPLPDNGVQIPGYQFSKIRADIWYKLHDGKTLRFGSTTYGANNSFGQPGFTVYDTAFSAPVRELNVTLGVTNLFGKDNGATGGLYLAGNTYQTLDNAGIGPTNWEYAQPRTVFMQISTQVGH